MTDLSTITTDPIFSSANDEKKLQHQIGLERLFNKNQTLNRIRREFEESDIPFVDHFEEHGIPVEFGFSLLVQMALHKRCSLPTLAGILRRHFEPAANASQLACDMLVKAAEADLVDWSTALKLFIVKFTVSDDVQRDLDRFQYPLPMVVPPKPVRTNRETGYLASGGSIILRNNFHEDDVCLDHINRMNRVRFSIDHQTAQMVKNRWRHLDRPKQGESKQEFEKRVKAFNKYDRTAKEVIGMLLRHGNEFYLTHRYDKRGRTYCQGYHVNYQGAPWNKAVIELAEKEYVQ